jgi:DNA replication protein DnaC
MTIKTTPAPQPAPRQPIRQEPCATCHGTGRAATPNPYALAGHERTCADCEGYGTVCTFCRNRGHVLVDVPLGDPRFGRPQPCRHCKVHQTNLAKMMQKFSILPPDLTDMQASFATFPKAMDRTAIRKVENYVAAIIAGKLGRRRGMILHGVNQIGKTGLAYCAHRALQEARIASVFIPSIPLFQKLNAARFEKDNPGRFEWLMDKLCVIQHLVIDDLGSEKHTETREEDLFQLLDRRSKTPGLATLITTNLDIEEISPEDEARGKVCQLEDAIGKRCFARIAGVSFADVTVSGRKWALIRE